jgi:hypothetical protein
VSISNSVFTHCETGLRTFGKGARLVNITTTGNEYGWKAEGVEWPCTYTWGLAESNDWGINITSAAGTSSVTLNQPNITQNLYEGVGYAGGGILAVRCGAIKDNTADGIRMSQDAILSLSPVVTGTNSLPGGRVDVSGNFTTIRADEAKFLHLENGRNLLWPAPGGKVAVGSVYNGCNLTIPSHGNTWHPTNPAYQPLPNDDFILIHSNDCKPPKSVVLVDNNPASLLACNDPPTPLPTGVPLAMRSPLLHCPACPVVNSARFPGILLNEALAEALESTTLADSANGDDLLALDMFSDVIQEAALHDSYETQWLGGFALAFMKQALGSATESGAAQASMQDPYFILVEQTLDLMLEQAITYGNENEEFYLKLDKALLYNLAGDRPGAIVQLWNITDCLEPDSSQLAFLDLWKRYVIATDLVISGQYPVDEFEQLFYNGPPGYSPRLNPGLGKAVADTILYSQNPFTGYAATLTATGPGGSLYEAANSPLAPGGFVVSKRDSSGLLQWTDTLVFRGGGADTARAATLDMYSNFYVTGQVWNGSNYDIGVIRYDSTGVKQWVAFYNSPDRRNDIPAGIAVDTAGFVYVTGATQTDTGVVHTLIRYRQCNCPVGARAAQSQPQAAVKGPVQAAPATIYPNPAGDRLEITWNGGDDKPVTARLYNTLGQEMARSRFTSRTVMDLSHIPAGIYMLSLTDETTQTQTVSRVARR